MGKKTQKQQEKADVLLGEIRGVLLSVGRTDLVEIMDHGFTEKKRSVVTRGKCPNCGDYGSAAFSWQCASCGHPNLDDTKAKKFNKIWHEMFTLKFVKQKGPILREEREGLVVNREKD